MLVLPHVSLWGVPGMLVEFLALPHDFGAEPPAEPPAEPLPVGVFRNLLHKFIKLLKRAAQRAGERRAQSGP